MILEPLTREDMEQIRVWRHGVPETLRTPYMLTKEMQEDYYENVICNRNSTTRYWALKDNIVTGDNWPDIAIGRANCLHPVETMLLIGYGGIENISWENRIGEISLLIAPDYRGKGYGREAVRIFLDQAFNYLNLEYVHGECYGCGPWKFWQKQVKEYLGNGTIFGHCKYWAGRYYQSYQFEFNRTDFNECSMRDTR